MNFGFEDSDWCRADMTEEDCDAVFESMLLTLPKVVQLSIVAGDVPSLQKSQGEASPVATSPAVDFPPAEMV